MHCSPTCHVGLIKGATPPYRLATKEAMVHIILKHVSEALQLRGQW